MWFWLSSITRVFVETPLRHLYFHGPWLNSFGFWGGMATHDVCAHLTRTGAALWLSSSHNSAECLDLVERHFQAFMTGANTLLYIATVYLLFTGGWGLCRDYWRLRQLKFLLDFTCGNTVRYLETARLQPKNS